MGPFQFLFRIQRSVLPSETILKNHMEDYFILWEPKDVVGGDVFWYRPCENGFLVVCADCTGHGVPGALMTMIATGALDQALIEIPNGYPSAVLQRMNQLVKAALGQDGADGESDDGLELGICQIDPIAGELTFSGARFFLWALEGDQLSEIKGAARVSATGAPTRRPRSRRIRCPWSRIAPTI